MEFDDYLGHVRSQARALRAAAVTTGPDAEVPSCPGWTVHRLVRHIGRVHNSVVLALDTDPTGRPAKTEQPPEGWDELLAWWDEQVETMVGKLRTKGPDEPAWTFEPNGTTTWWARRQAHETAIHRLDAELAAGRDHTLLFSPELAADGIDEALTVMVPRRARREPGEVAGRVLVHAADAGRAWLITLDPAEPPVVGATTEIDADASLVGTADAVYRAVWHRASTAVVTGDRALVAALRTP